MFKNNFFTNILISINVITLLILIKSILVIKSNQKLQYEKQMLLNGPSPFCAGRGTNHWTFLSPHRDYCGPASNLPRGNGDFLQAQEFLNALQVARLGL